MRKEDEDKNLGPKGGMARSVGGGAGGGGGGGGGGDDTTRGKGYTPEVANYSQGRGLRWPHAVKSLRNPEVMEIFP